MPTQATALRLSGDFSIDALTFDQVTIPEPGANEVLVRIKAVSLNYRDILVTLGHYDPNVHKPRVLTSDGAGEVVAVGSSVTAFKPGDRVVAGFFPDWIDGPITHPGVSTALGAQTDGTLITSRLFSEHSLIRIPDALTYEEAATLPCAGVTAWNALVSIGNIGPQDTVLLLGTGGVSILALQIAKLRGARVIITSSSDEKLQRAKSLGADETINYKTYPAWDKEVRQLTQKAGATHVVETGGSGTLPLSIRSIAIGGQVSIIGVLSGIEQPINILPILMHSLRIQGIYVGSVQMLREVANSFAAAGIHPVIDQAFPFEQSKEALTALQSAQHFGKIVITL